MVDLLRKGVEKAAKALQKHASKRCVYVRGTAQVGIDMTPGQTPFEVDSGEGLVETWESRDWLFPAADLVLPGTGLTTPEKGDRVRELGGPVEYVYEVMGPGNEPCWRYSDRFRIMLRVHSKLVEEK